MTRAILTVLALLLLGASAEAQRKPFAFHTDGCTFIPKPFFPKWQNGPCRRHDIEYWYGGTFAQKVGADWRLLKETADPKQSGAAAPLAVPAWAVVQGGLPFWKVLCFGARKCLFRQMSWGGGCRGVRWNCRDQMPPKLNRELKIKPAARNRKMRAVTKMPWEWRGRTR